MSFLKLLKNKLKRKKKEFFNLNMKILEREEKMNQRAIFYEKEKKIVYETLAIINNKIDNARVCLEKVKKDCNKDKTKIAELEKKLLCVIKQEQIKCSCKS